MHVTDKVLRNVISEKNANETWNRLLNLKKQLFKLEMNEGQDLNKHINSKFLCTKVSIGRTLTRELLYQSKYNST